MALGVPGGDAVIKLTPNNGSAQMSPFRIALAQTNPTLGDMDANLSEILRQSRRAAERGAKLVAFPELALTGGPLQDLAARADFAEASKRALDELVRNSATAELSGLCIAVGYLDVDSGPRNAVAVVADGVVVERCFKRRLPCYGVFDETRNFVPGDKFGSIRVGETDIALAIGDDITDESFAIDAPRAGLILHMCAAPYWRDHRRARTERIAQVADAAGIPVASVNAVGGQDDLVFEGGSIILGPGGDILAEGKIFREDMVVVDVDVLEGGRSTNGPEVGALKSRVVPAPRGNADVRLGGSGSNYYSELWKAVVLSVHDYVHKNGFSSAVVALSGGIDSALVAAIACDALGSANVTGISMPSICSSGHSQSDAAELAVRTGLNFRSVPVQGVVDAVSGLVSVDGVAAENVQARVRGLILMAVSNQEGSLPLNTGNKTEYGCGHNTLYGDQVGGFAPLKDLPKTLVWALARWRNEQARKLGEPEPVPESIITKEPSPELAFGQVDTELLPAPYDVLDPILSSYIEDGFGRDDLIATGIVPEVVEQVIEMVARNEFKRHQAPPGPKLSLKAYGRDRRVPVTNQFVRHSISAAPSMQGELS